MPRRRPTATKTKPVALGPHPTYFDPEQVRQREEIAEISRRDAVWKLEGFVEMVIKKGYRAEWVDGKGRRHSWQETGRNLFGEEAFNAQMQVALQKRREGRISST